MRRDLYTAIVTALAGIEDAQENSIIKHIDLWNQDISYIEQSPNFLRPAVFVEFNQIEYDHLKTGTGDIARTKSTFTLHIITDYNCTDDTLNAMDLSESIKSELEVVSGANFGRISIQSSTTSHDHADLMEFTDTYQYSAEL